MQTIYEYDDTHPVTRTMARLHAQGVRVGPVAHSGAIVDQTIGLLRTLGLRRDDTLLDVGCGALRIGHRLIDYLEPGHYHGIEPEAKWVELGLKEWGVDAKKMPQFDHNMEFDFEVFGQEFDAVLLRSIWSHASRDQIRRCMDQFNATRSEEGFMMASFFPAWLTDVRRWPYLGRKWRYKGQTRKGAALHRVAFLKREAAKRGLRCEVLAVEAVIQKWVVVAPAESPVWKNAAGVGLL